MKYKSQYKQDQFLYENFFKNVTDGFFIDIGASEHEYQNNTFFFEDLGWNGILIEPRKQELENLKNKRKSPVENVAIYKESRIFNELLIHGKSVEIIEVQTITFQDIIKKYQCNKIDYLSLDVEGAEYCILKTIDFKNIKIKSISVENNYQSNDVYELLSSNNFRKVISLGCDDIYINNF